MMAVLPFFDVGRRKLEDTCEQWSGNEASTRFLAEKAISLTESRKGDCRTVGVLQDTLGENTSCH